MGKILTIPIISPANIVNKLTVGPVLTIKVMFTLSRQSGFYSLYLLSNTFLSLSHKIPIARPHPF